MKLTSYDLSQEFGMMEINEIDLLKKHVAKLPDAPLIINIGAGFGTSSLAMLEVQPGAFIFSIDPQPRAKEQEHIARAGYANRAIRLLGKSQQVGQFFPYQVNCVFVDGSHVPKDVQRDIELWKPKVKPGGLMFFHDYQHPNYQKHGPDEAAAIVDRLMVDWTRLGVARYMV